MATQASGGNWAYEEFQVNGEKLASTDCARICSYHPGVVGCHFSVTLGKDLYGQSEGESCLGILRGCVEHEVCGGDMTEEHTCFFWWAHDTDPV